MTNMAIFANWICHRYGSIKYTEKLCTASLTKHSEEGGFAKITRHFSSARNQMI